MAADKAGRDGWMRPSSATAQAPGWSTRCKPTRATRVLSELPVLRSRHVLANSTIHEVRGISERLETLYETTTRGVGGGDLGGVSRKSGHPRNARTPRSNFSANLRIRLVTPSGQVDRTPSCAKASVVSCKPGVKKHAAPLAAKRRVPRTSGYARRAAAPTPRTQSRPGGGFESCVATIGTKNRSTIVGRAA